MAYKYCTATNWGKNFFTHEERKALPEQLTNNYCMTSRCYTPTEFGLFGVGICILGIMVGIVAEISRIL